MNDIISKPSISLAIAWLAIKILLFNFFPDSDLFMVGAGLNLVFLLLIILLSIKKTTKQDSFLLQFKTLFQPTFMYVLLVGIGIYVYYSQVDPGFIEQKIELSREALPKAIEEVGGWEKYKEMFPKIEEVTLEDYLVAQNSATPSLLSANGQALFSTFGLLFAAAFYSVLFLLVSKIALKGK